MSGFTKLDSSLTASSIWAEPDSVRIVWVTLLSMADKDGNVKASVPGLAHLARKTLSETEHALSVLLSPDPHSGRKELEGRRITEIDGGWHLVTHAFYRESGMSEDTKRYWREKKASQRSKMSKTVKDKTKKSRSLASGYGSGNGDASEKIYSAYPKKVGKPFALKAIQKALEKHEAAFLLDRTKAYATARGSNLNFVPHPSTWFNQERFNDDPATWKPDVNGTRKLSFEDRAKRKGAIQIQLNDGHRSAPKDSNGRAIYTVEEQQERDQLRAEMEQL